MSSQALTDQIANHHLAHALLLNGTQAQSLTQAANALAQAILCENKKEGRACGDCRHCLQVIKGMHADLVSVTAEADSQGIKIEQIRQVIARANLRPLLADSKVFIIDGAESMNEAAQNALLKTLEEPPGGTFFILLSTHPEGLLATVRSRCQSVLLDSALLCPDTPDELSDWKRAAVAFIENPNNESEAPDLTKLDRNEIARVLDHLIEYLSRKLLSDDEAIEKIERLAEFKEKITQNVNVKLVLAVLWSKLSQSDA